MEKDSFRLLKKDISFFHNNGNCSGSKAYRIAMDYYACKIEVLPILFKIALTNAIKMNVPLILVSKYNRNQGRSGD